MARKNVAEKTPPSNLQTQAQAAGKVSGMQRDGAANTLGSSELAPIEPKQMEEPLAVRIERILGPGKSWEKDFDDSDVVEEMNKIKSLVSLLAGTYFCCLGVDRVAADPDQEGYYCLLESTGVKLKAVINQLMLEEDKKGNGYTSRTDRVRSMLKMYREGAFLKPVEKLKETLRMIDEVSMDTEKRVQELSDLKFVAERFFFDITKTNRNLTENI